MVKKTSNSIFSIVAIVGFILSFIWENLHFSLYQNYADGMVEISFLLCASGDVTLIFLIYFLTAVLFKDLFWLTKLLFKKIVITLIISIIISFVVEKVALLLGWWQYKDQMPVIPIPDIGLSPFLAIALLPIITFITAKNKSDFLIISFGDHPTSQPTFELFLSGKKLKIIYRTI